MFCLFQIKFDKYNRDLILYLLNFSFSIKNVTNRLTKKNSNS